MTESTKTPNYEEAGTPAPLVQVERLVKCEGFEGPCGRTDAIRHRQRTQYVNDEQNWVTLCPDCSAENDKYWDNMWREYYHDFL